MAKRARAASPRVSWGICSVTTCPALRYLREFRIREGEPDVEEGQQINADVFEVGDRVDVIGKSKGRGFQGTIKRHGFRRQPKTHGQSDRERAPGSIGAGSTPGRVIKGMRMAGRMGNDRITMQNLEVVVVDAEKNLIAVRGSIPGTPRRHRHVEARARALPYTAREELTDMQVPVLDQSGNEVQQIELPADIFGVEINVGLMHQAFLRQEANQRQGNHKTKTRSEVRLTKSKWYRQKGTGRARHGARSAPLFVGGGVAHGPRPRKYTSAMPKKMRRGRRPLPRLARWRATTSSSSSTASIPTSPGRA